MATSGTITGTTANSYITAKIEWSESSVSTSNNTSKVTATLYYKKSSSSTASTYGTLSYSITINGTKISSSTSITIPASNTWVKAGSASKTVAHSSDGSKSITIRATGSISGTTLSSTSLSGTATLTTIARASSITSASGVTTGTSSATGNYCKIVWTPKSTSFTYKIKFTCGSKSVTTGSLSVSSSNGYSSSTGVMTYEGYQFVTSTWAPYITSAASATCTATLYTYSNGTSIGSATKTFTLKVNTSVKPNIDVTYSDYYGYASTYGYLTNKSKVSYSITQSTSLYGATVTYKTVISGTTYTRSNTSATAGASGTSGYLTSSGSKTISVTATDSRGRTDSFSDTFTVYSYSVPVIGTFTVGRNTSDNTKATAVLSSATYSVCNGSNSLSAVISYKKTSATSYDNSSTLSLTLSSGTASGNKEWSTNTFDEDSSYDIQLTVTDSVGSSTSKTISLSTITVLMDFKEGGLGLGIGKIAEGDYLDVGMDAVFNDDVDITGDLKVNDGYVLYGAYATTTSEYVALNIYITNGTSYGWIPVLVVSNKWVGYVTLSGTSATSSFTSISTYSTIYGTEPSSVNIITDSSVSGGVRLKLLWSSSSTSGMANVFGIRNMACPVTKIAFAAS